MTTAAVAAALTTKFAIRQADVSVVRHYPEQFFFRFLYQHHYTNATTSTKMASTSCAAIYAWFKAGCLDLIPDVWSGPGRRAVQRSGSPCLSTAIAYSASSPGFETSPAALPMLEGTTDLFHARPEPLTAKPPATRHKKTLAGMDIAREVTGGLTLRRTNARQRKDGSHRAIPAAKAAELLVCGNLGIVQDGEDVTERALLQLSTMFKEQLPMDVLAAMRALLKVGDENAIAVEDALISHGGADGLDHELVSGEAVMQAQEE
ncbi:hypothetical protein D1007_62429 [Hordeum vulgare]|nr:hypothetical protein D1007_62429 [Hordeum vulgare]